LNPNENKHRLLMLIDEFPRLSRMPFFTDALSYVAGYNIKVMLIMQSKGQLDAPDSYGKGNTILESCRIRSVYTPQDPDTAQWISDSLGPKTEVHQQTTYTGHRLAPWLGHVMVADQESGRPLLDPAEICKLPASDAIVLVAGFPPFKAKRLKYYEDESLCARADLPTLQLKAGGPYPFRPPQRPNPWIKTTQTTEVVPRARASTPPLKDTVNVLDVPLGGAVTALPDEVHAEIQLQLALEAEVNAQNLASALDEHDRLTRGRGRKHRRIPL
jgi:type IV secretion system protein VirD4